MLMMGHDVKTAASIALCHISVLLQKHINMDGFPLVKPSPDLKSSQLSFLKVHVAIPGGCTRQDG